MKKYLSLFAILLVINMFISNVNAKGSDIEISNVELLEKSDKVKSNIKYKDLNINLNTIFFGKDDYVKYKITIKNNTKGIMKIDEVIDNLDSDVIDTEYDYEKKEIKSKEEYTFTLTIKCIKDIEEEQVVISDPLSIIIKYDDGKTIDIDVNPNTKDNIINFFIIFVLSAISLIIVITKRGKKQLLGILLIVCLIPIGSNAISTKKELRINNNIKVYGKVANFESGILGNKKLKELAGTDTSTSDNAYSVVDTNIKKVLRAQSLPDNFIGNESNTISTSESRIPIYVWYDNGIIYYYSENEKILLNDDSNRLFQNLAALEEIDLSSFDTSNVTSMSAMFSNCSSLKSLDLSNFDTTNVIGMVGMFQKCENLEKINLSSFDTSNVSDMSYMFNYCSKLKEIDLNNFDTSKVTTMRSMFQRCVELENLDLSNFDTSNVKEMHYMFNNCISLSEINLSNFNTSNVNNMRNMFCNCKSLDNIDLSSFNTSKVEDMQYMFCNCESLTSLDITNFDTSKVVNFDSTFRNCKTLTEIDLSNFSTESATLIRGMFYDCSGLIELDLSNFDTSKVEDMSWLFRGCTNLERVDLSSFNTTNTTDINHMFCYCVKLKSIDMSNFDTSKVTSLNGLFYDCESLEEIDLSNFVTNAVTDMTNMFGYCIKLKTIYVSNTFNTSNVTTSTNMFRNNSVLVGGNGTPFNNSYRDKTYARIDTEETPGYFTLKSE